MIEALGLSKAYGTHIALREARFSIADSEVVGLLGPNGAGKTTLMKILTGYLHPDAGRARIDGIDVLDNTLDVQRRIGYLPENAPLYDDMLVQEYLQMVAALRDIPPNKRGPLISEAVVRTGLTEYLARPIAQLSKGYRQRVGLAQAILHRPKVLILDEPTTGLDPTQIVEIRELMAELAREATVLLSTHILSEVELSCERVLIISEGEVRADARLAELRSGDAAILSVDGPREEVTGTLRSVPGVLSVEKSGDTEVFQRYRVTASKEDGGDLCPRIYEALRPHAWRLAELRPDHRTLESVFRSVVEGKTEVHR